LTAVDDFTTCGAALVGRRIRVLPVVTSTNDILKAEAETGAAVEGDILLAEHQTAGRGRLDRSWESPPGKSLLFSVLLFPGTPAEHLQLMGLMVSLGVQDGLGEYLRRTVPDAERYIRALRLKWPNDLMVGNRKLCGILSDAGVDGSGRGFAVVGAGVNVNQSLTDFPQVLRSAATSLYIMTGTEHRRAQLLKDMVSSIEMYYNRLLADGSSWIAPAWLERSGIEGQRLEIKVADAVISGICVGLNGDGAIKLGLPNGQVRIIYSGDVC